VNDLAAFRSSSTSPFQETEIKILSLKAARNSFKLPQKTSDHKWKSLNYLPSAKDLTEFRLAPLQPHLFRSRVSLKAASNSCKLLQNKQS
jgi:hypothetical protein